MQFVQKHSTFNPRKFMYAMYANGGITLYASDRSAEVDALKVIVGIARRLKVFYGSSGVFPLFWRNPSVATADDPDPYVALGCDKQGMETILQEANVPNGSVQFRKFEP